MSLKELHINISKWLDGGDEEFSAIYNYYKPKVYRYALRYLKDEMAAEDMSAAVMIKIWEKRTQIQALTFENYLFTIARNYVITEWRRSINELVPISQAEQIADNNAVYSNHSKLEENYHHALNELPPQRRTIFVMHREQRLTYKQIAEKLDISPKTVENQVSSTLKQLRVRLAHLFYNLF